jgi:hypothetical protein
MSNHHNHPSHIHNFFNKHTALAILLLVVGSFVAGYFVARHSSWNDYGNKYMYKGRRSTQGTFNTMPVGAPYEDGVDYSAQ